MSAPSDRQTQAGQALIEARDNIALIQAWTSTLDLDAMRADRKTRYAVERAFMAIAAALRDAPSDLLAAHGVPVKLITGFRNVLAHTYDDMLDERVMLTIHDDLPTLDAVLAATLRALDPDLGA